MFGQKCWQLKKDVPVSGCDSSFVIWLWYAVQDKVYANAEAQAKLFMEYVHSSKDEADEFDFEGDRQYDGGSYDSAFTGNTKHDQV